MCKGSALHAAACRGNRAIARLLLDCGADVNDRIRDAAPCLNASPWLNAPPWLNPGATPLLLAASRIKGHVAVMELLLDHGADVEARTDSGEAALHLVSMYDQYEEGVSTAAVQLLVERGANVDATAAEGLTPLMLAAARGGKELVQALLSANVDLSIRFSNGLGALGFAELCQRGEKHQIVKMLKEAEVGP